MELIADENVDSNLIELLVNSGIDIKYASKGESNYKLFSLACKEGKIILSHDKDFLDKLTFSPKLSRGVIVIRIHPPEPSLVKEKLLKLLKEFSEEEIRGKLLVLREDGVEVEE